MESLVEGPRKVISGPIGRCVKRGWCKALFIDPPKAIGTGSIVLYGLTDEGRALLAQERILV